MISRSATHALRAMAVLGGLPPGTYAGAAQVAARIKAPSNYLGKLLQKLAHAGLVEGRKGGRGGFRLARGAGQITLYDILDPVERISHVRQCILGKPQCSHRDPCALHKGWAPVREEQLAFLRETTLKEVMV